MSYSVEHIYVDSRDSSTIVTHPDGTKQARFTAGGDLPISYPGRLIALARAEFSIQMNASEPPSPHTHLPPPKPIVQQIPVTTTIYTPHGLEFTGTHVTREHLEQFRDLREVTQRPWRYETSGVGKALPISDEDGRVMSGPASVWIAVEETVTSQSAGLLVSSFGGTAFTHVYWFDLFRVGQFVATVTLPDGTASDTATLALMDPDGAIVASGSHGTLRFEVSLRSLDKSRDPSGNVRRWSLEFVTTDPTLAETIVATVIGTARVPLYLLQSRIDELLGPNGEKVSIYGQNVHGRALARLKFLDAFTAGTFDINNVLDDVLKKASQDAGADYSNLQPDVAYNLKNSSEDFGGLTLDVGAMSVTIIRIRVGPSTHLDPPIPALTVDVGVHGEIGFDFEDFTFASVSLKDGWLTLEVGIELNSSGELAVSAWVPADPINIDVRWELQPLIPPPLAGAAVNEVLSTLEDWAYDELLGGLINVLEKAVLSAPKIMGMLLGADLTLTSVRIENEALVIDYVAPTEPDPKPSPAYTGVIGRSVTQLGAQGWDIFPRHMGDTWAAQNLSKIDHIVVVMMENRSYDHVLGYRGALPGANGENGFSPELFYFLSNQGYPIRELMASNIPTNAAHLKTRFPLSVGHLVKDVEKQLGNDIKGGNKLTIEDGVTINNPQGFIDDFVENHSAFVNPYDPDPEVAGVHKADVLGYYKDSDLAFYKFLAENYAYSDRYFSSHPGPTLPNRMFSLAGDLQYDRVGEAVLNNSNADFSLSRALNIFDLLTRKNVSWRVYESFPSPTMLRLFARYLGDNTNISPLTSLRAHLSAHKAAGDFPSVVFIDPATHHSPETDDHPPADMLRGQIFLKDVYDTLRAKEELWLRTLLIITYDEHGGFYDHVVPPIADARESPQASAGYLFAGAPSLKSPMTVPYGLRVPTFVVSPWVAAGRGPGVVLDHCSVLKTILARFCGRERPFLSDRVAASHSLDPFLTQAVPRLNEIPASPTLPSLDDDELPRRPGRSIIAGPVSRKALRTGTVDFQDLTGMVARLLGRDSGNTQDSDS